MERGILGNRKPCPYTAWVKRVKQHTYTLVDNLVNTGGVLQLLLGGSLAISLGGVTVLTACILGVEV